MRRETWNGDLGEFALKGDKVMRQPPHQMINSRIRGERIHLTPGFAWKRGASGARNKDEPRGLAFAMADRYCTVNCTVLLRDAVPEVAFTVIV